MFRILITAELAPEGLELLDQNEGIAYEVKIGLSKQDLLSAVREADALIVRSGTRVDRTLIQSGRQLKIIGRAGVGVDNIDLQAASDNGVLVMNTPDANSIATAEHTMALLLAACRLVVQAHESVAAGKWQRSDFTGVQLFGKKLGIIGLGRIGRLVASRARAFGMSVVAYDPYVEQEDVPDLDVEFMTLDDLLAVSDFITLHAAKTAETNGLIDRMAMKKMKDGVIIVNTSRGTLVDETALSEALTSGKVRAAAVDVFAEEPPKDNALIGHPKVIHTPHAGALTIETQRTVAVHIVRQVLDGLERSEYRNVVNTTLLPWADQP